MGDSRKQRVDSALSSLIDNLVPRFANEEEAPVDEKRDDALEWAKGVIDRHVGF